MRFFEVSFFSGFVNFGRILIGMDDEMLEIKDLMKWIKMVGVKITEENSCVNKVIYAKDVF